MARTASREPPRKAQAQAQAQGLCLETRVRDSDHATLKLWLRLLACTTEIQDEIRRRLRAEFSISLGRFDYLAQLYRYPEGLRMRDLSRHLMVTGGNVTGLTVELEREGLVARRSSASDRRAWIVSLTAEGRASFAAMASQHAHWLQQMFGDLDEGTLERLHAQLGELRAQLAPAVGEAGGTGA